MATTRYAEWLQNVSDGTFNPNNVNMNVKLVLDEYVPDEAHHPADVQKYIIQGVSVIVNDFFASNPMSNIIDEVKSKMELGFDAFPSEIAQEIDRVVTDETKREKLKELMTMPNPEMHDRWMQLKENGVGYFVFESAELGILCFCEEVI